jgi:hypothetical protein
MRLDMGWDIARRARTGWNNAPHCTCTANGVAVTRTGNARASGSGRMEDAPGTDAASMRQRVMVKARLEARKADNILSKITNLSRARLSSPVLDCRAPAYRLPDSATGSGGVRLHGKPLFVWFDRFV